MKRKAQDEIEEDETQEVETEVIETETEEENPMKNKFKTEEVVEDAPKEAPRVDPKIHKMTSEYFGSFTDADFSSKDNVLIARLLFGIYGEVFEMREMMAQMLEEDKQ